MTRQFCRSAETIEPYTSNCCPHEEHSPRPYLFAEPRKIVLLGAECITDRAVEAPNAVIFHFLVRRESPSGNV
jgi:hypothetical protein